MQVYPSQTKILEGLTKEEIRISKEALFKGVSTRFGLRTIAKYIENLAFIFGQSFQNLRLQQPSATSPLFFDNLHFEHFDKSVNHKSTT
jgi:hypothetical protein